MSFACYFRDLCSVPGVNWQWWLLKVSGFSQELQFLIIPVELLHDKTHKMTCEPNKDSDQPGHLPSLNRVFAVCMKKAWVLSYPLSIQQRLWSDWTYSDQTVQMCKLIWVFAVHTFHFVSFVLMQFDYMKPETCLKMRLEAFFLQFSAITVYYSTFKGGWCPVLNR